MIIYLNFISNIIINAKISANIQFKSRVLYEIYFITLTLMIKDLITGSTETF